MKLNEITSAIIGAAIKAQELVLKDGLNSSFALFGPCQACSVEPMILHYRPDRPFLPPKRPAGHGWRLAGVLVQDSNLNES